jgi:bifunctional non-homologous end joining protein LigD
VSLDDYQAKRKFDQTPEPQGGEGSGSLRFVIQKHSASQLHYDFRLEMGGVLKSWAVPKGPSLNPKDKRLAMMTEDHPYDYRTFEGSIPKGNYGAGTVMVWDEGIYEPVVWDKKTGETRELELKYQDKAIRQMVDEKHLTFILHGTKLNGEFALVKMRQANENAWLLIKADKDEFASDSDVTNLDRSATTGRTLEQITAGDTSWSHAPDISNAPKGQLPETVAPMLASLGDKPFDKPGWFYEIKWDGYRAVATITPEKMKLRSRHDQDFLTKYPPLLEALQSIKGATIVLDGEIVVLDDDGRSDFGKLQTYSEDGGNLMYYVFDCLHLDGHDLTGLPLSRRKEILKAWLPRSDVIQYSDHIEQRGIDFFKLAQERKLEGIMAKDASSKYLTNKRTKSWLKLKTHMRQEAVIGGYTSPRGSRSGFGALVLGVYDAGDLTYIGHAGGGFTERMVADLLEQLQPLHRDSSPFIGKFKLNEAVTWVEPKLVCEVEFREWTSADHMRQPVYIGLRSDKPPRSVIREQPLTTVVMLPDAAGSGQEPNSVSKLPPNAPANLKPTKVEVHNPDKVFWPDAGFTKGQLAEYYQSVASLILPYLKDRPQSLNRFPGGIQGHSFFQKNFDDVPDWLPTHPVHTDSQDRDINYILCNDIDALMFMVNLGVIEINPWNSRIETIEKPDWCVIDLDPEDIGFEEIINVAQTVHDVLADAKIPSYPKTSGASGIHIFMPMGAKYTYDQVRDFAHIVASLVNACLPKITSLERSPAKRQQKIYLDYLQNRSGQTVASAYCVRPRPGMPVSTPLHWEEVKSGLTPGQFNVTNMSRRLAEVGDLWAPVMGDGIDLRAAIEGLS